jgi:hypothetical protein
MGHTVTMKKKFVSSGKLPQIWANRLLYYKTSEGRKSEWGISLIRGFD